MLKTQRETIEGLSLKELKEIFKAYKLIYKYGLMESPYETIVLVEKLIKKRVK
jgi:hypothetical protein